LEFQTKDDGKSFGNKLFYLIKDIETLKEFGSIILKDSAIELLTNCRNKIQDLKNELRDLNERETLLGMEEFDGHKLFEWDKNLKPFEELWSLAKSYTTLNVSWTKESIFKQDSDSISAQTKMMYKSIVLLSNSPTIKKLAPLSIKIAEDLADDIRNFQKYIPVIAVFSNPGLKQRHFNQITEVLKYEGDPLSHATNLYLNKVIGMGSINHLERL
jgi:dynein heavy chain, axonemal